jgi:hypothetical protein
MPISMLIYFILSRESQYKEYNCQYGEYVYKVSRLEQEKTDSPTDYEHHRY